MNFRLIIFFFAFLSLNGLFFSGLHANPTIQGLKEELKEMPWYDEKKDRTKEYTAEEIQKHIPKQRTPQAMPSIPTIGSGTLEAGAYAVLAVLLAILLYVAYRVYKNRAPTAPIDLAELQTELLPEEVVKKTGIKDALNLESLGKLIDGAIQMGRKDLAFLYIFVYVLLDFSQKKIFKLIQSGTPRKYLREISGELSGFITLYKEVLLAYEWVAYKEALPDSDPEDVWRRVKNIGNPPGLEATS